MKTCLVALLGRKDEPADGVEDYCTFLAKALARRDVELTQVRVNWHQMGWIRALRQLREECEAWRGKWVIVQYTALAWSRRGFPFFVLAALALLRRGGARTAVLFHEPYRQGQHSPNRITPIRVACQDWVIHKLYQGADRCIFADPLGNISWLPRDHEKAAFVPIGANIPEPEWALPARAAESDVVKTVAVFCLTGMPKRRDELEDISHAMRFAASRGFRLRIVFCGRGTTEAAADISSAFRDIPVEVATEGLVDSGRIARILAASDVMLCVRGMLNPRRGSVIAGIACGLPIVGYGGEAEGTPLEEAGIKMVPLGDRSALGEALASVIGDQHLSESLRDRSRHAQREYFSWDKIAVRLIDALGLKLNRCQNA